MFSNSSKINIHQDSFWIVFLFQLLTFFHFWLFMCLKLMAFNGSELACDVHVKKIPAMCNRIVRATHSRIFNHVLGFILMLRTAERLTLIGQKIHFLLRQVCNVYIHSLVLILYIFVSSNN